MNLVDVGVKGEPLLRAHGLVKLFGDVGLRGVDLEVYPGEIVGLVGQNGAGKSTTIKCLLGLLRGFEGDCRVLGACSSQLSGASAAVKDQVGVVFDACALPGHLRVSEVGRMMAAIYARWDTKLFQSLYAEFSLAQDTLVKDLSRGMGMKLSLACALAHRPRVLILDEATAGLDPMAREDVLDLLLDYVAQEGPDGEPMNAVLMSSHITTDVERVADRVVCIDAGRVVFACAREDITDRAGMARVRSGQVDSVLQALGAVALRAGAPALDASGTFAPLDEMPRVMARPMGVDVLVADRFAAGRACADVAFEHVSVDEYMGMMLRGVPASQWRCE